MLRWVIGTLVTLLLVVVTWVLPAIYHARYDPLTRDDGALAAGRTATDGATAGGDPAAAAPAVAADPAWHPIPTAEQDQIYLEQTTTAAPHPGLAVEGKDGYLFLGDDFQANFAQAMGRRFYSREEVESTVTAVSGSNKWLANRGIAAEFVVVPATWSVYSDKMPEWTDGQVMPRVLDQLIAADPKSFPDLRPPLVAARATADTYPRLNSHWTPFGAFIGLQSVVSRLLADHPDVGDVTLPTVAGTTTTDSNNEFAGITGAAGPNNWVTPEFTAPLPEYAVIDSAGGRTTVPGDHMLDITQWPLQTENPAAENNHRALIVADSATTFMSPYLAAAFGNTMLVRHWVYDPEQSPNLPALVENYRPDVVINLVSERNLNLVTPDAGAWQAAVAYDSGTQPPVARWGSGDADTTLSVSQSDLGTPVIASLSALTASALAIKMDMQTDGVGTLTVRGTAESGAFSRSLRVAAGHNVLFAEIPAGLAGPITIERTAGQGTWTANEITAVAVP